MVYRYFLHKRSENTMENREICHCMGVSYSDIYNAVNSLSRLEDVLDTFKQIQEATSCSTGCGGCYNEVVGLISDLINGYADPPHHHHHD